MGELIDDDILQHVRGRRRARRRRRRAQAPLRRCRRPLLVLRAVPDRPGALDARDRGPEAGLDRGAKRSDRRDARVGILLRSEVTEPGHHFERDRAGCVRRSRRASAGPIDRSTSRRTRPAPRTQPRRAARTRRGSGPSRTHAPRPRAGTSARTRRRRGRAARSRRTRAVTPRSSRRAVASTRTRRTLRRSTATRCGACGPRAPGRSPPAAAAGVSDAKMIGSYAQMRANVPGRFCSPRISAAPPFEWPHATSAGSPARPRCSATASTSSAKPCHE